MATAQAIGPASTSLFSLFSGFIIQPSNIPRYWSFMYWLSPTHYVLEGLISSQFHGVDTKVVTSFTPQGQPVEISLQDYMSGPSKFNGRFDGDFLWSHRWTDVAVLCGMVLAFRLASTFFLTYVSYRTT